MPKPSAIPPIVPEIAKRVGLQAIHLIETHASILNLSPGDVAEHLDVTFQAHARREEGKKSFICVVGVNLVVRAKSSPEKQLAQLGCGHALVYALPEPEYLAHLSDEDLLTFARINGFYQAWPFIREHMQGISAKMGLQPPVLLPIFSPHFLEGQDQKAKD